MPPLLSLLLAAWPDPGAKLVLLPLPPVTTSRRMRVVIDAGHGFKGNDGNTGCFCQAEKDANLDTALWLAGRLEATGYFQVRLGRKGEGPGYPARLKAADDFAADAVVSLHTDARGEAVGWRPWSDERVCFHNEAQPGFAALYSEDGPPELVARRARLSRALTRRLEQAGFLQYDGYDYGGLYRADEEQGGWVDLRSRTQSVYFLRGSAKVPIVIIETHHALDAREVLRWLEADTQEAFAAAVARGLLDVAEKDHLAWLR